MTGALEDPVRAALGPRAQPLHGHTFVYVNAGYLQLIDVGTLVIHDVTVKGVLNGPGQYPAGLAAIVLVFVVVPGMRDAGDWGGVIILGEAPVNRVNPVIEGGLLDGYFGGVRDRGFLWWDRVHMTSAGQELMAREMAQRLLAIVR